MIVSIKITPPWAVRSIVVAQSLKPAYVWMRSLAVVTLGFMICANTTADVPSAQVRPFFPIPDPRYARLEKFFELYRCPEPRHVAEYIRAADGYGLDYRLLPAVSVRETLCGVGQQQNNRWGYHPGQQAFPTVAEGIDFVSRQLAENPFYKGKSLHDKLFTYNPRPAYPGEVQKIMQQIEMK